MSTGGRAGAPRSTSGRAFERRVGAGLGRVARGQRLEVRAQLGVVARLLTLEQFAHLRGGKDFWRWLLGGGASDECEDCQDASGDRTEMDRSHDNALFLRQGTEPAGRF
jgi:hypothetical protein